jgi:hypothetical protein
MKLKIYPKRYKKNRKQKEKEKKKKRFGLTLKWPTTLMARGDSKPPI